MKKQLSAKEKRTEKRKEIIRFKVQFTGMTEDDYAFLLQMAENIKSKKSAEKKSHRRFRKAV